ncbi:hemerythrin domain-containing protein [Kitasatospora sp. NPDC093102]|uniref:hemerythrin domain-containing protein n=1 Tax=Kitasatospora sp. NPDC093102 TaxID=3155069 RepID=UPI00344557C1
MSEARENRAAKRPDDVIDILLRQHRRIRELLSDVKRSDGEHKKQAFDELRALLAVHETSEQLILRPATRETAGKQIAEARTREEEDATRALSQLEKMDVSSREFDARFSEFERSVLAHAEQEEREEFPAVRAGRAEEQLEKMGKRLLIVEKLAPTHPHPAVAGSTAAQWAVGPFASLVDRVRDALMKPA